MTSRDGDLGLFWEAKTAPVKSLKTRLNAACHQQEPAAELISASSVFAPVLLGLPVFVPLLLFGLTSEDCYFDQTPFVSYKLCS